MKSLSLPNKIEDALPALSELLRRSVDGTISPLFVDYENKRVLIRSTTASAGTSVFEVALWGSITTGGVSTYLSTANFRSAVNVTGTTDTIGTINARNALSITGALDVFNGGSTFQSGVSCTGLAKFQNSFTDFLGDLRITGATNSSGTSNWLNVTAGRLNISSTADFRSALNVTGAVNIRENATASALDILSDAPTTPRINTLWKDNIVKAWVNFDGTLGSPITPRDSFNVSSITKNIVGRYIINFATAMANTNYFIAGMAGDPTDPDYFFLAVNSRATGSVTIDCLNNVNTQKDSGGVYIVIIGDQ